MATGGASGGCPASAPGNPAPLAPGWVEQRLRCFYPGSFAFVMATGIVSNAFFFLGHGTLSTLLLVVNLAAYPLLVGITAVRAVRYPREVWADLLNPRLVFSFFTMVAATDIFGSQLHLRGHDGTARACGSSPFASGCCSGTSASPWSRSTAASPAPTSSTAAG